MKMIIEVEGMMCGMCESHISSTLRNRLNLTRVSADRKKGQVCIQEDILPDEAAVKSVIEELGYTTGAVQTESEKESKPKKGLFRFRKNA